MCGIVGGFWKDSPPKLEARLWEAMLLLRHRGPNDQGHEIKFIEKGVLALGHTRLSIIDLSSAGRQPMLSTDGRYILVFNGEIYNYEELRSELRTKGCIFNTDTDTEVLLQAWAFWGEICLSRLQGMFAFVIYDRKEHKMTCVRDAFGIKPLFYFWNNETFVFASELSALLKLGGIKPQVDWQRSYDYLVHGDYDSQERTFLKGIKHLLPGHLMVLNVA